MSVSTALPTTPTLPLHWLSFRVGAEEYGIDILRVQEIRSYEAPTRLVDAPPCVSGVIDLRGTIVPLLDLREKFGATRSPGDVAPVVIVVFAGQDLVGLVVDSVRDVVTLGEERLRPMPAIGQGDEGPFMALASLDERTLILTDIDRLIDPGALSTAANFMAGAR